MAKRRRTQVDPFTNLLMAIGGALWSLIRWMVRGGKGRKRPGLDVAFYQGQWMHAQGFIEQQPSQALLTADKLLDRAMREVGGRGETFADRLRSLEPRFGRDVYQGIWEAHKARNQLAHEVGHTVSSAQAQRYLGLLERGLRRLGAL